MTEEEVIKRRLMIDGDGTGDDRRLNMLLKSFMKWCDSDDIPSESNAALQRMFTQLNQCEYAASKSEAADEMSTEELENYRNISNDITANIEVAKKEITNTKAKLLEAKTVRKNRTEYDILADVINKQPDRKETNGMVLELRKNLHALDTSRKCLERKLDTRRKELLVLLNSCFKLKNKFENCETSKFDDSDNSDEEKATEDMEVGE